MLGKQLGRLQMGPQPGLVIPHPGEHVLSAEEVAAHGVFGRKAVRRPVSS